ncbi:MAG: CocE/NonD family hydrolase [Marinicaulis sp.]|nr:CocE/NonD family hydrolase [Marinicaulis sp.]
MAAGKVQRMIVDIGVRTPMRDGVELVGDLYTPSEQGRWPVLLQRNPYDRKDPGRGQMVIVDPAWLARQGFAVLVQDTRGRGESEGEFDVILQEVDDGYDTVEWAAAQPWSTGAVGIYGSSYMGLTTYQAIASHPPHLKAGVAFMGPLDALSKRLDGGMFAACFYTWWAYLTALMTVERAELRAATKAEMLGRIVAALMDPVGTANNLPLSELDILSDEKLSPFWRDMLWTPKPVVKNGRPLLGDHLQIGDAALLHISGYRDFSHAAFDLAAAQAGNDRHRFIAGPWTHRGAYSGFTGAREYPGTSSPAGALGWGPLIAAWFDIHLRGGTGADYPSGMAWLQGDPIRYYVEGENQWASAKSWPPATKELALHLSSDGDARSASGNGRLLSPGAPAPADGANRFTADPHDPFPTHGGSTGMPEEGPEGVQDQRAVDHRKDVLVYTSDVLEKPVRIAGRQKVSLHFSSSAPDADICVKLVDVDPHGFAGNVTDGRMRVRYRKGGDVDWLTPGEAEEIAITLHNTAHVFKPGHRIRVMITGADYPHFSRNLHTKTVPELGTMAEAIPAEHKVHHGPTGRSRLILSEMSE